MALASSQCLHRQDAGATQSRNHEPAGSQSDEPGFLDLDADELPEPQQVLVIADPRVHTPRFGLPVDRVAGLVDGGDAPTASANLLVQRRPIDGRLVNVLDPRRLVERAREVIEQMASKTGQTQGG